MGLWLVLVGGCCFAPPPARQPVAPIAQAPTPVPVGTPEQQVEAAARVAEEAARAQSAQLTPEQRLAEVERVVSVHDTTPGARATARAYLDSLEADFERARVRAARRGLDRIDREVFDGFITTARADLRAGRNQDALWKLAQIPDGVPQARQRDRMRAEANRAIEREAVSAAVRGSVPRTSPWDGHARCIDAYMSLAARDPDSVEIISCGDVMIRGDEYYQDCVYRARNGFGGMTVESTRFFIQRDAVVRTQRL